MKETYTFLLLAALFAGVALFLPDYAQAAMGMFIGSVCWPVTRSFVSIFMGERDAQ